MCYSYDLPPYRIYFKQKTVIRKMKIIRWSSSRSGKLGVGFLVGFVFFVIIFLHIWSPNFVVNNQGHLTICKVFRIYSLKIIILGNFLKFFKWNLLPETDVTRKNNCIFWYCSCPLNLKNRIVFCVAAPELLKKKLIFRVSKGKNNMLFSSFSPTPTARARRRKK